MSDKPVTTVKMLSSVGGTQYTYLPGDIINLEERIAKAWIKEGICEKAADGAVPRYGPGVGQVPTLGAQR